MCVNDLQYLMTVIKRKREWKGHIYFLFFDEVFFPPPPPPGLTSITSFAGSGNSTSTVSGCGLFDADSSPSSRRPYKPACC